MHKTIFKVTDEQLAEKIADAIEAAKIANDYFMDDATGVTYYLVTVSLDAAWFKRPTKAGGASSHSGYVSFICDRTNQVIAFGVKNSYCKTCCKYLNDNGEVDKSDPDFPHDHQCTRTFELPPGQMEPIIGKEAFQENFFHFLEPIFCVETCMNSIPKNQNGGW